MCGAAAYGYAKEHSGPLRPSVLTMEETVKSIIGPVYDKFHLVPDELLRYVGRKVDESVTMAHGVPVAARTIESEMVKPVYSKYEPVVKMLYERYEPMAEQCVVSVWRRLNQVPVFLTVADVVLPKAAYCAEKYDETVVAAAEKGCRVSVYMPLVPTEKIATMFSENEA